MIPSLVHIHVASMVNAVNVLHIISEQVSFLRVFSVENPWQPAICLHYTIKTLFSPLLFIIGYE